MSPKGRVKVALAGLTTNVLAVFLTLLERAATGRLRTKTAEPITVAAKQAGRTTTVSAITVNGPLWSYARPGVAAPRLSASTQTEVNSLVFISITIPHGRPSVEQILTEFHPPPAA